MSCGAAMGACLRVRGREAMRLAGTTRSCDARGRIDGSGDARLCKGALGVERLTVDDEGILEGHSAAMLDGPLKAAANRGRQWRAQRSCASPLHAGLDGRVDAAMAPACGRHRGDATRALVVFAGTGGDGGAPGR
jgi:hypothetical protein